MSYTDLVRQQIRKKSTKVLLEKYKTYNSDGRREARRELEARGVRQKPYTVRKKKSTTWFGSMGRF